MINEPKRYIVLSGKINIVGIEDKSDMSEDYEKKCLNSTLHSEERSMHHVK